MIRALNDSNVNPSPSFLMEMFLYRQVPISKRIHVAEDYAGELFLKDKRRCV